MKGSKHIFFLIFILFSCVVVNGQRRLSDSEVRDISERAERQMQVFFYYVSQLGEYLLSVEDKKIAIDNVVDLFTPKGAVEERSKNASTGRIRLVRDYLNSIDVRARNNVVIVSYEVIDPGSMMELRPVRGRQGSDPVYEGCFVVRQFYCRKQKSLLGDKPGDNFDLSDCDYQDVTDKEIWFEVKVLKSAFGESFSVLIDRVVVRSVR